MLELVVQRKVEVEVPSLGNAGGTVFFGPDDSELAPIEVLVLRQTTAPAPSLIREIQKWRKNDRVTSVVVAIEANEKVYLYGPAVDRQPIAIDLSAAKRILQSALLEPNPVIASRQLVDVYDNFGSSEMPGVKNKGLFASHHLRENLPKRRDWSELRKHGEELATKRHRGLIEALGFSVFKEERNTFVLKAKGPESRVIAILLEDSENFESPSGRFPSSPVAWGLSIAAEHNVPWLIMLKKDQIRLHPGRDGIGVGQKGQAETFLELNLAQIDSDHLALLPLIFSAQSLEAGGEVQTILDESSKFAVVLGARLRERVYESVVPSISIAVAKKMQQQGKLLDSDGLKTAYSLSLRILFRLLFQAYAEDRALLPLGRNAGYDANSLKEIAKRDMDAKPEDFGEIVGIWHDLVQVWDAIDEGNPRWQIPAYNGGLFGRDPVLHPEGALIKELELTDAVLGPALQALLIDKTVDGVMGPVDFKSLSVREFGTIYEGLLESSLSLADVDLTVDSQEAWVPAKPGEAVMAKAGEPYFHSASGERKATGSYFTPKFVVDHLVEQAIDPTIDKHLDKIAQFLRDGDQSTAAREFFDFRVGDLAMGSAHFLVAAIDRIEAKMRSFLANPDNTVPGVIDELATLRKAAIEALKGDEIAIAEIEDSSLLRRQIARRCIYGIDVNDMAVELSRLAIWIHTFVPGLPMSSLDHNLICANSLTGIASIEEALEALTPNRKTGYPSFFEHEIIAGLEKAKKLLIEAAKASEADKHGVTAGRLLATQAKEAAKSALTVLNVSLAARLGVVRASDFFTVDEIVEVGNSTEVATLIENLKPANMPGLFPEVFLRKSPGFDALVGNPPWEKAQIEEQTWWGVRIPGLRGLEMKKRKARLAEFRANRPELEVEYQKDISSINALRLALLKGPFPGLGKSNVDLYQAFVWRNWQLLNEFGRFGLVLPRGAMAGTALGEWRKDVLANGHFASLTFATNSKHWIFDQVDTRYSIVFAVVSREASAEVCFSGPVSSIEEMRKAPESALRVSSGEFDSWTPNASFPLLPDSGSFSIFKKLKQFEKLGDKTASWDFGLVQGDLNSVTNKDLFELGDSVNAERVKIYSGATFNLWNSEASSPYGTANTETLRSYMLSKLQNATKMKSSSYYGMKFTQENLPMDKPRVAFRDITNATNTRTTIAALLPPRIGGTHRVAFFVERTGTVRNEAFLLGLISSIPFDWYSRRVVEMVLNFEIMKNAPLPHSKITSPVAERLIEITVKLAAVDSRYLEWAKAVGVLTSKSLDAGAKSDYLSEIDALSSILYGLSRQDVIHIFETFHRGWDYMPRLTRVLEYYDQWKEK
jgi:hypothetical protein